MRVSASPFFLSSEPERKPCMSRNARVYRCVARNQAGLAVEQVVDADEETVFIDYQEADIHVQKCSRW